MNDFFDDLETRGAEERAADQYARLRAQLAHARAATSYYGKLLGDADPDAVAGPEEFARLPLTRKADLIERQQAEPPFGGLNATEPGGLARLFVSPGPIHEPEGAAVDFWRCGRALHAAGFRAGDIVHNAFAYHLTPGGWILDAAARGLGCAVIPAGTAAVDDQARALAHFRATAFCGTPDFLRTLLERAAAHGLATSALTKAAVSGAALLPDVRAALADLGVAVRQCYVTADLGLIAYETSEAGEAVEGMVVDEEVIVEIVRPGTGDPVPEGDVGEVVVTTLVPDYPLIRFATGDLSAVLPGPSPCGRTNMRIKGWMGRADQTTKVRGMFVHPEQVAAVVARHREIEKARLVVDQAGGGDVMTLYCEAGESAPGLVAAIEESVRAICRLKGAVELVPPESLANDGKVIDDLRPVPVSS